MESVCSCKVKELLNKVSFLIKGDLEVLTGSGVVAAVQDIILAMPDEVVDWSEIIPVRINYSVIEFTLAHYAAFSKSLPEGYSDWGITTRVGGRSVSVAEVAARFDALPEDFDQWHLCDEYGWTAAHAYASQRPMPGSFEQWNLSTHKKVSVLDIQKYMQVNGYPSHKRKEHA